MKKTVFLKKVLEQMRQTDAAGEALPFSIKVRSWNKQNKMGGKLKVYDHAILCFRLEKEPTIDWEKALRYPTVDTLKKNPNHYRNYTRNIELITGEVRKIHALLIVEFNGMEVEY